MEHQPASEPSEEPVVPTLIARSMNDAQKAIALANSTQPGQLPENFVEVLRAAGELAAASERQAVISEQRRVDFEVRMQAEKAQLEAALEEEMQRPSWAESLRSDILQSVADQLAAIPRRRFEPQRDESGRIIAIEEVIL